MSNFEHLGGKTGMGKNTTNHEIQLWGFDKFAKENRKLRPTYHKVSLQPLMSLQLFCFCKVVATLDFARIGADPLIQYSVFGLAYLSSFMSRITHDA